MSDGNLSIVEINFAEANVSVQRCAVDAIDRSKIAPEKLFLLFIGDRLVGVFLTIKEAYERWEEIKKLECESKNETAQAILRNYKESVLPTNAKVNAGNDRRIGLVKTSVK
ncbi:hypothetical protein IFT48_27150 [Pseudomonas fluorescens]|uniref:hypothetical protein n=1 Tax=Pseudomonas fluorescens TaxID=294 RepID=UPI001902EE86|nr:hypothetical protein [Pseudomonas fluorescens]MBD8093675.1 hypothetical protein [Pseudomonas fluorescens]MBD8717678.1 hypothetical protein [Pseudomonas fluorescens]